jgi:hypothetical protein
MDFVSLTWFLKTSFQQVLFCVSFWPDDSIINEHAGGIVHYLVVVQKNDPDVNTGHPRSPRAHVQGFHKFYNNDMSVFLYRRKLTWRHLQARRQAAKFEKLSMDRYR